MPQPKRITAKKHGLSPESIFWYELSKNRIPKPESEYMFAKAAMGRKWRADYCWPEAMLILEVEGGVYTKGRHTRPTGFLGDMEKYNAATQLGYAILRYTPSQLSSLDTIRQVVECYNSRLSQRSLQSQDLI